MGRCTDLVWAVFEFCYHGCKMPKPYQKTSLSADFATFWEQTDKDERNDRIRYQQVLEMIRDDTRISKSTSAQGLSENHPRAFCRRAMAPAR